jgi:hypothetical protein
MLKIINMVIELQQSGKKDIRVCIELRLVVNFLPDEPSSLSMPTELGLLTGTPYVIGIGHSRS